MNKEERLRQNRKDYNAHFLLGLARGRGLLSVLALALFNFLNRKNPVKFPGEENTNPAEFERMN